MRRHLLGERAEPRGDHAVAVSIDIDAIVVGEQRQQLAAAASVLAGEQFDVPVQGVGVIRDEPALLQVGERVAEGDVIGAGRQSLAPHDVECIPHRVGGEHARQFRFAVQALPSRAPEVERFPAAGERAVAADEHRR